MKLKQVSLTLVVVAVGTLAVGSQFLSGEQSLALFLGFLLFSLNILAMSYLASVAMKSMNGSLTRSTKLVAGLLGLFKFSLLVGGLYLGLIYYNLSGVHFGAGALLALLVILWNYATGYLKSLAQT